jgi:cation transporter-like permease
MQGFINSHDGDARQAALEAYFHQEHRERHHHHDKRGRRILAAFGALLLGVAGFAFAGAFGANTPWFLIKIAQLITCIETTCVALLMIREAAFGGRHG